jgi:hypothetical protein
VTDRKTEKDRQFADGRGRGGVGEEPIRRPQVHLVLYKSFNILWYHLPVKEIFEKIRGEIYFFFEAKIDSAVKQ